MTEKITSKSAGEVSIDEVALIVLLPSGPYEVDIKNVFAEINLFEDIFSNTMYGNILIGDSNNLMDQLAIQGLEAIRIQVTTPGLSKAQRIYKTFGIYSISDQQVLNNDRYQSYRLHFCSLELLADALGKPLNRPIPAKDDGVGTTQQELIPFIYKKFFIREGASYVPRNLTFKNGSVVKDGSGDSSSSVTTDLIMGSATYNHQDMPHSGGVYTDADKTCNGSVKIKFIAPNWTALKTINWVTNRAVPQVQEQAGSFLFFESNKAFHFANVNALIKGGKTDTAPQFVYKYFPSNLLSDVDPENSKYSLDIPEDYARVLKFQFGSTFNILDESNMSYFGTQIRAIDPVLKRYRQLDYSYTIDYDQMEHTVKNKPIAIIPKGPAFVLGPEQTTIETRRNIITRHRQPYFAFDNDPFTPNTNPAMWTSQRAARLASLSVLVFQILVNGRTDMKVGNMVSFTFPSLRGEKDNAATYKDTYFNGFFLVSAIRHFISPVKHHMTLELIKDGLEKLPDTLAPTDPEGLNYAAGP